MNIIPTKAYFTFNNPNPYPIDINIGEPDENFEGNQITHLKKEENIIRELLNCPAVIIDLFSKIGIEHNNCWIGIEVLRSDIIQDWQFDSNKGGDIDLILGNFYPDKKTPDLSYIIGIQIKTRKVSSSDELKRFASGEGTRQSENTVRIGFDKTYLFHLLIKDPNSKPDSYTEIWNTLSNTVNPVHLQRCLNAIKPRLEKEFYGYGIIGWAQADKHHWRYSGTVYDEIIKEPIFQPWKDQLEILENRKKLISFLE
jgi:hypothetical protein